MISAIVPTFNRAPLLAECIESLLRQTRPLGEIIVVDDGSTDGTAQTLSRYGDQLRLIRQENAGKAAALNRALGVVRGDFVWICDDDDIALPHAAELLGAALERSTAGMAYGRYLVFDDEDGVRSPPRPPGYWPADHQGDELRAMLEDCFIFQFASLIRRTCYETIGPFRHDLVRSQDYDMTLRLIRQFECAFVDADIFLQRGHAGMRGTAKIQFSVEASSSRWVQYDRVIFTKLRSELRLMEYLPRALRHLSGNHRQRAALLQRGCVFARHQMWDEALEDMAAAVDLAGVASLHEGERAIAARFLTGKHGCQPLIRQTGLAGGIARFGNGSPFGQALLRVIAQPLVWRSREALAAGRPRDGFGYLAVLLEMCGPVGFALALGHSAGRRLKRV